MRLPLCDDDALYASRRLKRHQRRFDIAEKRDGESERERDRSGGGGGVRVLVTRGVLRFSLREAEHCQFSDKLTSHFVFTELVFVMLYAWKMPVALSHFSLSLSVTSESVTVNTNRALCCPSCTSL